MLTYEKAYCNELFALNSVEAAEKHCNAVKKLSQNTFDIEEDPVIPLLTSCIMGATPDFLNLDEPKKAEEGQLAFSGLLHR